MTKIRLLLVDDQRLMRDGLRPLLELEDDLEVAGEAVDVLRQKGDLHFRRPRVALAPLVLGNDARLLGGGYGHFSALLGDSPAQSVSGLSKKGGF